MYVNNDQDICEFSDKIIRFVPSWMERFKDKWMNTWHYIFMG